MKLFTLLHKAIKAKLISASKRVVILLFSHSTFTNIKKLGPQENERVINPAQ